MSIDGLFTPRSIAVYGASAADSNKLGNALLKNAAPCLLYRFDAHTLPVDFQPYDADEVSDYRETRPLDIVELRRQIRGLGANSES